MQEIIRFEDMNLSDEIKHAVKDMGFDEATKIQAQSIPLILEGKDVIGHSQTGTGKTAAFSIPSIEKIDKDMLGKVQVLILCPTRELAIQACDEIKKFTKYLPKIKAVPIYGGQAIERQITALKNRPQIVVGTPGRVMDHMRRKTLKLDCLKAIILDEADEMLSMGFREDIETILKDVPEERQTILFSATMSKEIMDITKKFQKNPELIKITRQQITVPSIEQYYFEVPRGKKNEVLSRLLDVYNPTRSMVFCNTKKQVDELVEELNVRGYAASGLHGDMKQTERTRIMNAFRNAKIDILVATDVAARGIDIDDIDAVFNYDIPQDMEYYVHRIGRTGRIGKEGKAFTFVCGRQQIYQLRDIENFTKAKIVLKAIPSSTEVIETKSRKLISEIKKTIEKGSLEKYNKIIDELLEDYSSLDISTALIKLIFAKENSYEPTKSDDALFENEGNRIKAEKVKMSNAQKKRSVQAKRQQHNSSARKNVVRADESNMDKISINLGRRQKVSAAHILGAVAGESGLPGKSFGRIEILDTCTIVSVPHEHTKEILAAMKGCKIMGYKTITRKI
ncbi:MAG: DEAD/DEAH box helicase [Clostridiales bacterium]|nr:DEAD/DEAH box helicase [Clostridiales bacterium]